MTPTVQFDTILFEICGAVATVTLNRPAAMNAFNEAMLNDFARLWALVRSTDDIHVVVLRAADGRAFCTGVDVHEGILHESNIWSDRDPGDRLSPKQNKVWKPVLIAVHGLFGGGAFYWLNECDVAICSDDAEFFDPHVTYGMVAALEPIGLARRIPLGEVLRMALLGNDERIGAATALRIGLVSEVVPRAELWARADALAHKIAAKPPAAVQGTVRAIWESLELPRNAALAMGLSYTHIGNPLGKAQVDRQNIMAKKKTYSLR
ncbi:MAG TPA: enoyl-CoA hydratase/isomerase family protein [Rhizomicrobium sp.]|nr:enoyl-CoA hydratase/isomerase family protein [Rhizomicrobium sp.]